MTMTSRQRVLAAIRGDAHDRVPVAQHNFAFAARWAGITQAQYRGDPRLAARVLVDAARHFGYDCIIIDFDTCALAEAMGASLVFPENEPARVQAPVVSTLAQVATLRVPDPMRDGRLPLWLETTREVRRLAGDDIAVMARADQGPFGLLFLLRGHEEMMFDVLEADEAELHAALAVCTEAGVRFARAQLEAGADLTSIGDSASGESLISPEAYLRIAQPFQRRYKQMLGSGVLSLHICGRSNHIIEGMVQTGCEVLELDHYSDLSLSLETIASRCCVFGNIDPGAVLSQGRVEDVLEACRVAIEAAKPRTRRFVLCPGCLANGDVPAANIAAMTQAAHTWGQRG
jgi:uroporphyrinogen decarboxylase